MQIWSCKNTFKFFETHLGKVRKNNLPSPACLTIIANLKFKVVINGVLVRTGGGQIGL